MEILMIGLGVILCALSASAGFATGRYLTRKEFEVKLREARDNYRKFRTSLKRQHY